MLSSELRAKRFFFRPPRLVGWGRIVPLILLATLASAGPIVQLQFSCSPVCSIATSNSYGVFDSGLQAGAYVQLDLRPTSTSDSPWASESMTLWNNFTTDGPVRPGILEYRAFISGGTGSIAVGGVGASSCGACTAPFTLGVPFEIVLRANAFGACEAGVGCYFGSGHALTDLTFRIIDAQTMAPVEVRDINLPEPRGLLGGGLLGLFAAIWSRRKRLQVS